MHIQSHNMFGGKRLSIAIDYCVVGAGGGVGVVWGGGGGGAVILGSMPYYKGTSSTIIVGAGVSGDTGGYSAFGEIVAYGGAGASSDYYTGGACGNGNAGGAGISGSAGGSGGGSAGAAVSVSGYAQNPVEGTPGPGTYSTISGSGYYYGGGGAGWNRILNRLEPTALGGEGNYGGGKNANSAGPGTQGIVIFRYPGSVAQATGGSITISGGYVYHLFTSSGTFAF